MGTITNTGSRIGDFLAKIEGQFADVAMLETRRKELAYNLPTYIGGLANGEAPDLHNLPCYWITHQMEAMADNFRSEQHDIVRVQFFFADKWHNDRQSANNYVLWAAQTMTQTLRERRGLLLLANVDRVLGIPEAVEPGIMRYRMEYKCYLV